MTAVTHTEHRRDQKVSAGFGILTVSDSRTLETDESGELAARLVVESGHRVVQHLLVKNRRADILHALTSMLSDPGVQVVVTIGGTGVGERDVTVDTVTPLFDKELPGFGELFRRLSMEEIGMPAVYSRATAGLIGRVVVYCLPGSKNAVATGVGRIVLDGLGHLLWEVNRR